MNKKLLKNKNYVLVVLGNFVSLMGSNIQQFVLSLYVLALTGSATIFASMLAVSILPRIILSPIAGVFGDWFDKKRAIVSLDLLNFLILSGFGIYLFVNGSLSLGSIYLLVILMEIIEIFFGSSMSVVLPSIVEKEDYLEANSYRTMVVSIGQIMAPIFGALIYGAFGLLVALMFNAVSFLLSAISEMFITVPKTSSEDNPKTISGFKKDLAEGIKLVKNSKAIMTVISIAIVLNFTISPFMSVGLTFLVKEVLQQSDFKFGLLQTVFFLSMVATPLLLTAKMKKMNLGKMIVRGFIIVSMLIVVVALTAFEFLSSINNGLISFIIILLSAFFMGILITAVNISIHTLIQKIVPLEYMGRASTVLGLFSVIAIPIGQMIFGYLYDIINPGFVFIINAFIVLISVFIFRERLINIETEGISILETKTKVESSVTLNEV